MYAASNGGAQQGANPNADGSGTGNTSGDGQTTDVPFEEVNDKK
jgi:hypothetical protein